jgi:hypothetical protein
MAPERRWAWPRLPAGGPDRSPALGGGRTLSPFVGLELKRPMPPDLASPPMSSLPPRRWPMFLEGVVGVVAMGECGGVVAVAVTVEGLPVPEGLKLKSGKALMDFCCRIPPEEPRFEVGSAWRDIGRLLELVLESEEFGAG